MKLKIENLVKVTDIVPCLEDLKSVCACCGDELKKQESIFYKEKMEYFCPVCAADGSAARHIIFYFSGTVSQFTDTIKSLNIVL